MADLRAFAASMSRPALEDRLWWTDVRPDKPLESQRRSSALVLVQPLPVRPPNPPPAKPVKPTRSCEACGESFTLPRKNSRHLYCSDTCRETAEERGRQRRLHEKLCRACGKTKPLGKFGKDRSKRDGRMSQCSECANAARKARYYANLDHEIERGRNYYAGHREQQLASSKAWALANPDKVREIDRRRSRKNRARGGDPGWQRRQEARRAPLLAVIGSSDRCYLCLRAFVPGTKVCIDHDHTCCPELRSIGCPVCVRGQAHGPCNQLVGLAGEDVDVLRTILRTFPLADSAAKARIAAGEATDGRGRHRGFDREAAYRDQDGDCYLCLRAMPPLPSPRVHVDHDATCPVCGPSTKAGTRSCPACRRGLAHAACNQIIGLAGEDMNLLAVIVDSFLPVQAAVRQRIAEKAQQGTLAIAV
jgi:hypothetical protein